MKAFLIVTVVFAAAIIGTPAFASTPLSQGYSASEPLASGAIVSLDSTQSDVVEPASTASVNTILGVVINGNTSVLSLSGDGANEVQVATSGVIPVLVSDINGPIEEGDQITASPIKGVGMKATANAKVVGIAQAKPVGTTQDSYTDGNGKKQSVTLGEVDTLINVSYYYKQPDKTIVPAAIQNVANAIAGKSVTTLPIVVASIIFFITLVIVSSIIYAMIRSSIISVGRNPMAQSAVYRDVIQLSVLVLAILGVAIISIYIVLTRF